MNRPSDSRHPVGKTGSHAPGRGPEWTPLGRAVARWWPLIALALGLVVGVIAGLVTDSLVTGAVVAAAFGGILLAGFYVTPRRGWPNGNKRNP